MRLDQQGLLGHMNRGTRQPPRRSGLSYIHGPPRRAQTSRLALPDAADASEVGAIEGAIRDEFWRTTTDAAGRNPRNSNVSRTSAETRCPAGGRWHARGQGFESPQL